MLVWNVLPPCMATVCAIAFVGTVSWRMAASLVVVAGLVIAMMFRRAAAGKPLHHEFADRAAAVDGEMTDVVGNMAIVKAFGGFSGSTAASTPRWSRRWPRAREASSISSGCASATPSSRWC